MKRTVIANLLQIANALDNIDMAKEADELTKVAKRVHALWGEIDHGNIADAHSDAIREIAYQIMADEGIEGEEIPDDIWEAATNSFIENYTPDYH